MNRRVALVTGASSGIGLAIAQMLVSDGYQVTVVSRTREKLQRAADELQKLGTVHAIAANVGVDDEVERTVAEHRERFGRLDLLVNNAGQGILGELETMPAKHIDLQLAVNLRSVIGFYQHTMDLLKSAAGEHGSALVVNVSSIAGKQGQPRLAAYSAAKHGIVGLTEAMNRELASTGVKSTVLCPGYVDTTIADPFKDTVSGEQMIRPEDLAESVRFLTRLSPMCVVPEILFLRPGLVE
ncbi:MAG: SDR family NAD(P)-dependent oxidoreductase [Propionibacteriales bacterium]|nr:SDR family NAD(P)-dependent oxidoreductase [Propionibacteriales bacterium]